MTKGDRLEGVLASLEIEKRELERQMDVLRDDLELQRSTLTQLQEQRADAAQAVETLSQRLTTLEDECTNFANFYVAVERLYLAAGRDDAFNAIVEIVANLVGSEEIAIFEVKAGGLTLTHAHGVSDEPLKQIPLGTGQQGWAASNGHVLLPQSNPPAGMPSALPYERSLTACVPFLVRGRVTGAVSVFGLLPQKPGLTALDHAIFEALQRHAGLALYVATALPPGSAGPS
jgi:hypothetical protein